MWSLFLAAGLVDEVIVAVSPERCNEESVAVTGPDLDQHFATYRLARIGHRAMGPDTLHIFRRGTA